MILADTSAWVEFLRRTGSAPDIEIDGLLEKPGALATTDVVLMEVLAGARDARHHALLRGLLARCRFEPVEGPADYEAAASLYRRCRERGRTVRALTDCLIACVALRAECTLLHADRDFERIAEHVPLRLA